MRDAVVEKLVSAAADGTLTTFRVPGGGGMCLTVDAAMVQQARKAWGDIEPARRASTFDSIKRSIKSGLKRHRRGTLTQQQCDEFASDCALWFVHQLMFGDGERHIVDNPDAGMFRKMAS